MPRSLFKKLESILTCTLLFKGAFIFGQFSIIEEYPVDFSTLPCQCNTQRVDTLRQDIQTDMNVIFTGLNYYYQYQGVVSDPRLFINDDNFQGSALYNAIANFEYISLGILEFLDNISDVGIPNSTIAELEDLFYEFIISDIYYANNLNLQNTGYPSGDPEADATALFYSANALGTKFTSITGNLIYIDIWSSIAVLTTQVVQAYRGVLVDLDNSFIPADPSYPISEFFSAATISQQLQILGNFFASHFVFDIANSQCTKLYGLSSNSTGSSQPGSSIGIRAPSKRSKKKQEQRRSNIERRLKQLLKTDQLPNLPNR